MNSLTSAPTMAPASGQMSTAGILVIALPCILVLAIISFVVSSIVQSKFRKNVSTENSYFDGNFWSWLGWKILSGLLTSVTFGIAYPWAKCMMLRWEVGHTVINGKRLRFIGSGAQLFGKYILWALLTIVTFGIFGIWMGLKMKKWITQYTVYANEPIPGRSRFTAGIGGWFGIRILAGLMSVCTLGIGAPWAKRMIIAWEMEHTYISGSRLCFAGKGGQLFGKSLLWGLLTVITLSIYGLFVPIRFRQWIWSHTGSNACELPEEKKTGVGVIIAVIGAGLAVLLIAGAVIALFFPNASFSFKDDLPANNTEQTMFILNDAHALIPTLEDAQQLIGNYESCVDYDEIQGQTFSFVLDSALSPKEGQDDSWTQTYFTASGTIGSTAYLDTEQDILYLDYGVESAGCPTYLCLDGNQTGTGLAAPLTKLIHAGNGIHSVEYPYDEAPEYVYVMALAHITDNIHIEEDAYYFVTLHKQPLDVTIGTSQDLELNNPFDDVFVEPGQTNTSVDTDSLIGSWTGCYGAPYDDTSSDDMFYPDITCLHWQLNADGTFTSYTMGYINVGGGFSEMYNPVKHLGTWAVDGNTLTLHTEVIDYPAEEPSVNTDETESYTVHLENGNLILENNPDCNVMLKDANAKDVYAYVTDSASDQNTSSSELAGIWVILGAPEANTVPDTTYVAFADGGWYEFQEDGTFSLETRMFAAEGGSWFDMGGGEKRYEGTYLQEGDVVTLHYTTTYKQTWNEATQNVVSQPVTMDETEQFNVQPDTDNLINVNGEHPRFGQLCIFQRLADVETPIGVLLGHLAFEH